MVQFMSINFFLVFLQFLLGFSKVPVFLCHSVYTRISPYCTTSLLQTTSTLSLISYSVLHDLCSNIPVNILTLDVPVPVYSAYKNLVISSIGLSRFNRLGSSFLVGWV